MSKNKAEIDITTIKQLSKIKMVKYSKNSVFSMHQKRFFSGAFYLLQGHCNAKFEAIVYYLIIIFLCTHIHVRKS